MAMFRSLVLTLALGVGVTGCAANSYTQFYRGAPDGRTVLNYVASTEPLQVYSSDNFERDIKSLMRRGYVQIGASSFNSAANSVTERQLREQAEKVNAAVVLVASRNTGTVSGVVPLTLPNNSTTYTNGNATVYGSGGTANVYGSATTTTYGTNTVMMPYTIQRADFDAAYFVKRKHHLGVGYGLIDSATRTRLQSNAGALIDVLVDGSPAARADILPGDIVLTIDGERVDGPESLNAFVKNKLGQEIVLGIDRNGTSIEKRLTPIP